MDEFKSKFRRNSNEYQAGEINIGVDRFGGFNRLRRIFGLLLFIASVLLILKLTVESWDELLAAFEGLSPLKLTLALALAIAGLASGALYNERLVASIVGYVPINRVVLHAFSVSQVVRYLPGKIWGILYQGMQLRDHASMVSVASANLIQFSVRNIFSICLVFCIVLLYLGHGMLALVGLVVSLALMQYLHIYVFSNTSISNALNALVPKFEIPTLRPMRSGMFLLCVDWITHIFIWVVILPGTDQWLVALYISCIYTIASFVSIVAVFAPAGLGVREAMFVVIGDKAGFGPDMLLAYGLAMRFVLTVAEFVLIGLFAGAKKLP